MFVLDFRKSKGFIFTVFIIIILTISGAMNYKVVADINDKNIIILLDNPGSIDNPQSKIGDLAKVTSSMVFDSVKEEEVNISITTFGEKATVLKGLNEKKSLSELKR